MRYQGASRRTYGGLCGDVQVKLGGNTVFVPLLGWSFFLPVSAILISGFQIYYKIIFKKRGMYYESEKTVIISLAALACAGFIAGCGSDKKTPRLLTLRKQK